MCGDQLTMRIATSANSWKCARSFPGLVNQVGQARAFLAQALQDFPLAADAVLICSELSANAVMHSASGEAGGQFTVRVEAHEGDYLWIEVKDQGGSLDRTQQHRRGRPGPAYRGCTGFGVGDRWRRAGQGCVGAAGLARIMTSYPGELTCCGRHARRGSQDRRAGLVICDISGKDCGGCGRSWCGHR